MAAEIHGERELRITTSPPRADVDEAQLLAMSNEAIDELFRSSPPGDIPDGNMRGTVIAFPGTALARPLSVGAYWVGWQGKVVDRERRLLRNKVTPLRLRQIVAQLDVADSWVDDRPCVVLDYSYTSNVAKMVRDEIRLVAPGLYLGVIWMWHKRIGWFTLRGAPGAL